MGKGDKKTRRGKITIGSYGKKRPKNKKSVIPVAKKVTPKVKPEPKAKAEPKPKTEVKTAPKAETKAKAATKKAEPKEKPKKDKE